MIICFERCIGEGWDGRERNVCKSKYWEKAFSLDAKGIVAVRWGWLYLNNFQRRFTKGYNYLCEILESTHEFFLWALLVHVSPVVAQSPEPENAIIACPFQGGYVKR